MQIRFEEIHQLSKSILDQLSNAIEIQALKKALEAFDASYKKSLDVKQTSEQLKIVLSKCIEEFPKSDAAVKQQCEQLLAMLKFIPYSEISYKTKIQDILFDKFQSRFQHNYKTDLKSIYLTKEGLIFDFTSVKARDLCKTLLGYFNFQVSQSAYDLKLSIPHQQVYKLFTLAFYIGLVSSETPDLIKKIKQFYTEAGMEWKSACTNSTAPVEEENAPTLQAHFQHYFLLLDLDIKKIYVEFTTSGCVFFAPSWTDEKHITALFDDFQKHSLEVQRISNQNTKWFESFHSENPYLPKEFKDHFQENSYNNAKYILIPPHCLERLLSFTGFAPKYIQTSLVNAYQDRKLDYHTVTIQYLANHGLSIASRQDVDMICHYAETENEALIQWSIEPVALIKKQGSPKHILILLDDTSLPNLLDRDWDPSQQQAKLKNQQLHEATIATCIHIIEALPNDVVITLCAYQSGYPNINRVKKSDLGHLWREKFDFITPKTIDQRGCIFGGFTRDFAAKEKPNRIINISKDFNVNNHPAMVSILQSSLQTVHISYIPVIIGAPGSLLTIQQYSHFAGYFVINSIKDIPPTLGTTIAKAMAPSVGPALCGITFADNQTTLFIQPKITFISGFSYHAYSRIPKKLWLAGKPENSVRFILHFEDKTIITSPKFHPITEQNDFDRLEAVCSKDNDRFLLDDGINFDLESEKKINQPQPTPKKAVTKTENQTDPLLKVSQSLEFSKQTEVQQQNEPIKQIEIPKPENTQSTNNINNKKIKPNSKTIEIIKRLFSLSTAIQLTALLILLGLVLSSGYGALIIAGLVSLSIGLISQLIISYTEHQRQQTIKDHPSENDIAHQFKQLVPSSLGGKFLMGLAIVTSIILLGFCVGFILRDSICVSLLAPVFDAMQHFLSNGMLDINLSGIPLKTIEIAANTICTCFLSTIPLVVMLFFKCIHEAVMGCTLLSESTNETEDLFKNSIDYSKIEQKPKDIFASESGTQQNYPQELKKTSPSTILAVQ